MAKLNVPRPSLRTHEGGIAKRINAEQQLRRSVMACMLWENQFYEDGQDIAARIAEVIPHVHPETVAQIAIEAREQMKLRHAPLLIVREMARSAAKDRVAFTLSRVIQRADELSEFLAIYWKDGRQPLSAQVKKGLAKAFSKFNSYSLAKYNRDGSVKLCDVLFLCHAKPKDAEQEALWKRLIDGTLEPPDTWEVALSSGGDKRAHWERLLREDKLGALALLRNLRNFNLAGVDEDLIFAAMERMDTSRVLPFRFIAAARHAPQWEDKLEPAMLRSLESHEKLPGKTILLVDRSGSMSQRLSDKSDLTRYDAACGLAMLIREVSNGEIWVFNHGCERVPPRRGFALRDAMGQPYNGTYLGAALDEMNCRRYDRLIVITDEQTADRVPDPKGRGYMINVASYRNGVGYGPWIHIDGFSESVVSYIQALEKEGC